MSGRGIHGLVALLAMVATPVSFAQLFPVSGDAAAKVISLTGQVSVLHDSQPWALNIGDSVQIRQVIVTGPDGYARFEVSDGSSFEVFANSNVIFRKNPGNLRDLLDLFVGRVKIHIQKFGSEPNPNRVLTPTAVISVRGTTFDVSVDDDDETTLVSVEEGAVEVRHALKPGQPKIVSAGESLHVYRDQPLAQSIVDKGQLMRRILHGLGDAAYRVAVTSPGHGGITVPHPPVCACQTPPPPPPNVPPPPGSPAPPGAPPPPGP
jgi:ferric-dicitrate binding protein FerR (iron transport regulator)